MAAETASDILFAALYVASAAAVMLLFHVFVDVPYKRKKEQEALLKASSEQQAGVWPPAPTTYQPLAEPEAWVWCLKCHRVSTLDAVSANGGFCDYEDCKVDFTNLVAWDNLKSRLAELPQQPEVGAVYPDLVSVAKASDAGEAD